ncbi:hypothetical protein NLX67_21410 [Domibacillus sp. A3M-37]|uniref:immunoglobulin-like domain-containing protein n=1 Tax=Domibacillus sp. A3M-37 TaxID=2962037 RepID=UPI0020B675F2|nr:immunoglobulin-like domain-containing protein [Domibacillus sp. A3M-37]MCP3764877.1 hypothetical protein [Domibacillus sp. A3M-37]
MTIFLLPLVFQVQEKSSENSDEELTKKARVQELLSSKDGVTLTMKNEQYTTFSNRIVLNIQNDSNTEFSRSEHFLLEKNIDGTWYEVPSKSHYLDARDRALHPHKLSRIALFTDELEYNLAPGEYRTTHSLIPDGNEKEGFTLVAPFEVIKQ